MLGGLQRVHSPALIDWEGRIVWEADFQRQHHHIMPYGDDGQYLYVANTTDCPEGIQADVIRLWDQNSREQLWEWSFCQYYEPPNYYHDWTHLNAVDKFPGENSLVFSPRNQNTIAKGNLDTDEIEWVMGVDGDFGLSGDQLFYRQHAPEIQENGNILLFDNGRDPDRTFSRAVEYSYDTEEMTAEVAWTYEPDPEIFSPIWGDADRLDNGNTLVTFGLRNSEKGSYLHEVTPEKTLVWELRSPDGWGWYRSDRIPEPPSGFVLEP